MPCPPWLCREERGPASEPSCGCRAMGCVPQLLRQSPGRGSPPQGSQRAAHRRPGLACGCGVAPGPTGLQCPRASVSQAASSPHRRPAHSTQDAREWHRFTCRRSSGVAALMLLGLGPAFSEALPALGLLLAHVLHQPSVLSSSAPAMPSPCGVCTPWSLYLKVLGKRPPAPAPAPWRACLPARGSRSTLPRGLLPRATPVSQKPQRPHRGRSSPALGRPERQFGEPPSHVSRRKGTGWLGWEGPSPLKTGNVWIQRSCCSSSPEPGEQGSSFSIGGNGSGRE